MFDVREFMADQELGPFPFTDRNGDVWELPHIGLMTADDGARLLAGQYEALEEYAGKGAVEALNSTPVAALKSLVRQWLEHSGVEMDEQGNLGGKSSAPSPSSRPTARPSRPTSRSAASKTRKR